jgi:hypothetical protein
MKVRPPTLSQKEIPEVLGMVAHHPDRDYLISRSPCCRIPNHGEVGTAILGTRYSRVCRCGRSYFAKWQGKVVEANTTHFDNASLTQLSATEKNICAVLHVSEESYAKHRPKPAPLQAFTAEEIAIAEEVKRVARNSMRNNIALAVVAIPIFPEDQ